MAGILHDLRVVEVSAFIAAPIGGMTLAQLGADVVRIDPIGGNIDHRRWPLSPDGTSLYWTALNKAKRSVALALNKPEGQEIARALICAPGEGRGILLTCPPGCWRRSGPGDATGAGRRSRWRSRTWRSPPWRTSATWPTCR